MLKDRFDNWFDKLELLSAKVNKLLEQMLPEKCNSKKIDILLSLFFASFYISIAVMVLHLQYFWVLLVTQIVCLLTGITLTLVLVDEKKAVEGIHVFLLTVVHFSFFIIIHLLT